MTGSLTIVVPAYNAGSALVAMVRRTAAVAAELAPMGAAIVVVDDGSTDRSVAELRHTMAADPAVYAAVELLVHTTCRGKGAALRTGFLARPAVWVGFCDGDGDIEPEVLLRLGELAGLCASAPPVEGIPDAVCAVKTAAADLPLLRRVASEVFKAFRRVVLPLGIQDSQTGAKLFAGGPFSAVLPQLQEDGFAFDLEALAALRASGHGRFLTVPVRPQRVSTSSVTARSVVQLLRATVRIAVRYRRQASRAGKARMRGGSAGSRA